MRIKKREKKGKIEPLNLKNVQNSWIFLKCFARDLAWKYLGNMELIRFLRFFFYKNIFQNQLVPRSQNSKIFWMYKTQCLHILFKGWHELFENEILFISFEKWDSKEILL